MSDYQKLFDGIMALLEKNKANNTLAQKCLDDCDGELAFTPPPKKNTPIDKQTFLEVLKRADEDAYQQLHTSFAGTNNSNVLVWYFDTENGSYAVFTDVNTTLLEGIKYSPKTLNQIRKEYFLQKEALKKLGETPIFNYEEKEITFLGKKLLS